MIDNRFDEKSNRSEAEVFQLIHQKNIDVNRSILFSI